MQVDSALPTWLKHHKNPSQEGHHIEAIEGNIGGVDDGLTVSI